MGDLHEIQGWLDGHLGELANRHGVPGTSVAVLAGGDIAEAATGVLNVRTGVAATTDSVFQIGSITKVWTTSLIMQLVDEGRLDLDAPVRAYVPEFTVADARASAQITVRQLTCHVAGFEGDIFTDTGRGHDAVEKYLGVITEVPQLFAPGERFSYNNAGYVVLGRIVEVLREKPFGTALRDHLATPLGLSHLATDADEAILHRAAVGHIEPEPEAEQVPAPVWSLPASNAPAGSLLAMSAADLVRFAAMHLAGGTSADGAQILSDGSVSAMQERQVELPNLGILGNAWGLGWEIFDWAGGVVIGHDGGTIGQSAFLRIVPGTGVAVAVLTNGGNPLALYSTVMDHILQELAGVRVPSLPAPPDRPEPVADPARYVGRYAADVVEYTVEGDAEGRLWQTMTPRGVLAEAGRKEVRSELVRLSGDTFVTAEPVDGMHMPAAFVGSDPDGRAKFLHQGRAVPRVER
ncbi:class A beta-lactamase-related serine hydrolase [Actinobacteria bacterium YIM 96077]|uniref:Serine hydrolase n=1 Tax=Phytoactinopolyspora halophila TaxID=1981511 RepID=A0A329R1X4_9ACTN|nr:serine hydrolase domain-containing protein [Phytoactinopolyspora halophila]AYY12196.1 class A beta-lactamase-related serine hydrolase [Actinobacteria bacterium YIM 96077]RAW18570.1 serine hydrolase [Phytoactinopolyspora halophila]